MPTVKGLYRVKPVKPGAPVEVIYTFGDDPEERMTEQQYRVGGHRPSFEDLPWWDD